MRTRSLIVALALAVCIGVLSPLLAQSETGVYACHTRDPVTGQDELFDLIINFDANTVVQNGQGPMSAQITKYDVRWASQYSQYRLSLATGAMTTNGGGSAACRRT